MDTVLPKFAAALIAISLIIFEPCYAQGNIALQMVVREARLDSLAALSAPRSLFPRAAAEDTDFVRASACIAAAKDSSFTEILSDSAGEIMSSQELELAHSFYKSPLGRKYGDLMVWQARADLGLNQTMRPPSFSKEEEYAVAQFSGTTAGSKLTVRSLLTIPQTATRLFELVAQIVNDCKMR
ncbi:hypothetical protein [Duganella hordei]|uniref:hypothetical protein n=1 Tax=Duganella hordei TaxID=2865934 RepID=UPI0030E7578B